MKSQRGEGGESGGKEGKGGSPWEREPVTRLENETREGSYCYGLEA